jgi:hypothetical protein
VREYPSTTSRWYPLSVTVVVVDEEDRVAVDDLPSPTKDTPANAIPNQR